MRNQFLLLLCAAILSAGCAATTKSYKQKEDDPIVLLNRDLHRTLKVDPNVEKFRDVRDRMLIRAKLHNRTGQEILYLQTQTVWRDEFGLPLRKKEPPWQTVTLTPGQEKIYEQTSPTAQASRFTIRIRYFAPRTSFKRSEISR